ncbi:hypothetical protein P3T25_003745 [Paraburkholderia sp. GAS32]
MRLRRVGGQKWVDYDLSSLLCVRYIPAITITDQGDRVADPTDKNAETRRHASTRLNSAAYSHGMVSQPVAVRSVAL